MQSAVAQSDSHYNLQWHLSGQEIVGSRITNTQSINVAPVWEKTLKDGRTKIRGQGTYIAIVDGDLPIALHSATTQTLAHPDLIANISTQHSVDYYPSVIDTRGHATAVAGIAAARGYNDIGVRGVAPWAKMYGLNVLGIPAGNMSISANTRDMATLNAMVRHSTMTTVSNNSWGSAFPFNPSGSRLEAWEMAIETGIRDGFHGKGTVYVWAAGNDRCISRKVASNHYEQVCNIDTSNYDGRTKHYATIPVSAVSYRFGQHLDYSELGANLWVCAPSRDDTFNPRTGTNFFRRGITTTYRGIFRGTYHHNLIFSRFGGTSAAAPMVSGVVALMRQVNPSLSWRDVKLILANSASQNNPTDDDWAQGAVKYGLSSNDDNAQYHFNHKYGFGLVDAEKAVDMAGGWINLPPSAPYMEVRNSNLDLRLSADNPVINSEIAVQSDINFIEYVEIPIRLTHPLIQDLSVKLTSPSGTTSSLFIPSTLPISSTSSYAINTTRGFWRFGSSVHLGEDPSGVWKLRFEDTRATTGTLIEWGVRIRGYQIKMDAASVVGLSDNNLAGNPLTLSLVGASWEKDLQPNDFGLQNAPAGLRIASVRRTSDTQVQLNLALDSGFARDYLFQVIATTSTVPNIRNPLVSNDIPIVSNTRIIVREDTTVPAGTSGSDYSFTLDDIFTSVQALTYTVSGLPPGLEINGSIISGTPISSGNYRLEIVVTRADGISRTEFFDFQILPTLQVQVRVLLEGALLSFCDRTPQVRDKIVSSLPGISSCEEVSQQHLGLIDSISLRSSGIGSLLAADFRGLTGLETLDLGSNDLTTLPAGIFSDLTKLRILDLSSNDLTALPADVFNSLGALQTLNLSANNLTILPIGVFANLINLMELNLSSNRNLTSLPIDDFRNLTRLSRLRLGDTNLDCINVDSQLHFLTSLALFICT